MKALIHSCTLIALLTLFASQASAQNWAPGTAQIGGMEVEIQQTPQFQAGNVKDKKIPRPRSWVEVEVEFKLSDRVIKGDFVDQVMVRYYIAVKGERANYMMTGDVTHVNVPTGEDVFSIAYLPPTVIDVAKGKDSDISTSDVMAVGVEIIVNGVVIAAEGQGQSAGWWKAGASLTSQAGILPKSKTPFSLLWIDRHADEANAN